MYLSNSLSGNFNFDATSLLLLFSSIDKVYCNLTRRKKEWNKWLSNKLKLVNKVISYRVNGYWLHLCMFWKYFILQDLILLRIVVSAYPSVTWLKTILVILFSYTSILPQDHLTIWFSKYNVPVNFGSL